MGKQNTASFSASGFEFFHVPEGGAAFLKLGSLSACYVPCATAGQAAPIASEGVSLLVPAYVIGARRTPICKKKDAKSCKFHG